MKKRISSGILVMFMLLLMFFSSSNNATTRTFISDTDIPLSDGTNSSESALEFVSKMGAGWNLGNSFCCCDDKNYGEKEVSYYETLWGNPITTKATIDAVKAKGFKTVRIPITYRNHIDTNNQIDSKWLSRIKEVVDYVIQNDMYCIINVHHENWLVADTDKQAAGQEKLEAVWKQISEYFSEYGTNLIFEGFNEVINSAGQWDSADSKSYAVVNSYNQTFVDAVRTTGGNNASRYLIVNTYAAKATRSVIDGFILPQDSIEDHIIVSTHIYDGIDSAKIKFQNLYTYFVKHDVPVIIGEWGKINSSSNTEDSRISYAKDFLATASGYGIPCVWWDDGGIFSSPATVTNYAILQRKTGEWYFDKLATEIVNNSNIKYVEDTGYELVEDVFCMKEFSGWKTGDYNYTTGNYVANSKRLCLIEEKKLLANVTYTAIINDKNYHVLVRIMNSSGKLVKSYNLSNMYSFSVDSNDYTARVSIYNYSNSSVCNSYEDYATLFNNGFEARIEAELPIERDEINQDITESGSEEIVVDTDIFGMKNFENWRSGNYSCYNGKYTASSSRICLNDYIEVSENQTYLVNISEPNYCVLVRLLDENNKMIESISVKNGGTFTVQNNETKAAISLYNSKNSKITYDDYQKKFQDGFYAYIEQK